MKKVFLYLYPIKEYTKMFLFNNDSLYDRLNIARPLPILNSTINKRYREKGYQVVFALYPDRELYGIEKMDGDKIIYTDISFSDASAYDEYGNEKKDYIIAFPNEDYLLSQLGDVEELIVGGYHAMSCVKRVAEVALKNGINTLVDIDLTEMFFSVYRQKDYFDEENYNMEKFKNYMITRDGEEFIELGEKIFNRNYSSPVYGFTKESTKSK